MSTSSISPFSAADQSGFSLVEMLVAIGIGGMITAFVGAFFLGAAQVQKSVTLRAELESFRTIYSGKIDCSKTCAGLKNDLLEKGRWKISVNCHSLFNDATIMAKNERDGIETPLFTLEGSVCKARRPKQCLYACHNQDIMLERGYLYPSVDRSGRMSSEFNCPSGNIVGIDFSTNRIICSSSIELPPGPMCKQDVSLIVKKKEVHLITMTGPTQCSEHTMDQVRQAHLRGTVKVELSKDYTPKKSDRFLIIHAQKIHGRFANPGNRVSTDRGTFNITYEKRKVFLTDFELRTPDVSSSKSGSKFDSH